MAAGSAESEGDGIRCKYVVLVEIGEDDYKRPEVATRLAFCDTEEEAKKEILKRIGESEIVWVHAQDLSSLPTVDKLIDLIENPEEHFCLMNPRITWTVFTGRDTKLDRPWFRELIEQEFADCVKQLQAEHQE